MSWYTGPPVTWMQSWEPHPEDDPGEYEAHCELCGWHTNGNGPNVDDAMHEHAQDRHPRRLARTYWAAG